MQGECPRHGSPLSGKVCPRRPTLGMPPSGDKDDGTPGAPPVSVSGTRREGCAEHRSAPTLSQPRRDWAAPGWPANRRTVKDASPPTGIPRCPPSQYAVSGSTRSSSVRTASRGNVLAWSPAPLSSPATAKISRTRGEGSWIGSLRSRPDPRGRRRSFDPCRESLRGDGRVRGPFHSTRSADRGVNILPRVARERMAFCRTP